MGGKVPIEKNMPESARKVVPKVKVDKEAKGILEHLDAKKFVPISKQTFYCKDSLGSLRFPLPIALNNLIKAGLSVCK